MLSFFKKLFTAKRKFLDEFGNEETNRLPKKMPADFSIELSMGGGMRMRGSRIVLKGENSSYSIYKEMKEQCGCSFNLSATEMNELLEAFLYYGFDKVEMEETRRLDYPSTNLTVRWKGFFCFKNTSQISAIKSDSPGDFSACVQLVRATANAKAEKHKVPIIIKLDETLLKQDSGFAIYFDNFHTTNLYPWYTVDSGKPMEELSLLPGVYLFKLYCYDAKIGVIDKFKQAKFSEYVYLIVKEKQLTTFSISTNGFQFLWETDYSSL